MRHRKPDTGSHQDSGRGKLAFERRREILDLLESSGAVRVTDVAARLGVTQETVRRDLHKLGREGLLRRTHGGAIAASEARRDEPFAQRRVARHAEKQAIARLALAHIEPGDVIALDASSTAHELARLLHDTEVTVVTNALPATISLSQRTPARVMSTGGWLDPRSLSWAGPFAEQALGRVHIGKLFLSSKGVDLTRGLSEIDEAQAAIKRRMMDAAEEVYLLVDHSKFDIKTVVYFALLREVDAVITDAGTSDELIDRLEAAGICTLRAPLDGDRSHPNGSTPENDDE